MFDERGARWVFISLAAFGVYLCLTAVAETQGMWSLVLPKYIASSTFKEFYGRGRGPLLNPVANGMVMSLGLCAALMAWPRLARRGKFLLLALVPVFAYGVYCTLTRTAWIGAVLALLIVVALSIPRAWRAAVISGALLVSAVTVSLTWENLLAFKRDKELSVADMAESAKLRPILATVAWHMFLDRPLLGCGYGQYPIESRAYLADRDTELQLEKARPYVQHNVVLGLLTETGLVGAGLFVALLASWTQAAWRVWRGDGRLWARQIGLLFLAFMGAYLPNAMMHDVSLIPMVNMLLFFLAGTVVGLVTSLDRPRRAELRIWTPEAELAASAP
jgi:O-antigen ligase